MPDESRTLEDITVVATMCRPGDSAETVATTCGSAIPGMEARIADEGELLHATLLLSTDR